MAFNVELLPSAEKDLEDAFDYYANISLTVLEKFHSEFMYIHDFLEQDPFFQFKYNVVRTLKLKSFPYLVHFIVDENKSLVTIIAIVFGKREKNTFEERI